MGSPGDKAEALEWVLGKIAMASKKPSSGLSTPKPAAPLPAPKPAAGLTGEQKKARKDKEVELWHAWNGATDPSKKKEHLDSLLGSMGNLIQRQVNAFRGAEVPKAAVLHVHKMQAVKAIETWDPKKGGALQTWVTWNLKHARRYVENNKNLVYNPENVREHFGSFNAVKAELTEKMGHEPDANTIHDHILTVGHPTLGKLSLKDIKRLEKEQRRSLIQNSHDTDEIGGSPFVSSRAEEVKLLIVPELSPEERLVHEYTFGLNGKKQLSPGEIAKKLKFDNSKVSKLRKSIRTKMSKYIRPGDV